MGKYEFSTWLQNELKKRDWTRAIFARRTGISPPQVSRVYSGLRPPGNDFCEATARAFQISPEEVFRIAGILPPVPEKRAQVEELNHLLGMLDDANLQEVIDYARHRLEKQSAKPTIQKKTSRRETPARTALMNK